MKNKKQDRKYIRISSVLPVQIIITDKNKNVVWKTTFQGFTRDINEAGVCLEITNFDDSLITKINSGDYLFSLSIDLPNNEKLIQVFADPRWIKSIGDDTFKRYAIGVLFTDITEHDVHLIIKYAYRMHRKPKQILALMIFFILIGAASFFDDLKMRYNNIELTREVEMIRKEKEQLDADIIAIEKRKKNVEENLAKAHAEIAHLEKTLNKQSSVVIEENLARIKVLKNNSLEMESNLKALLDKENILTKRKETLSKSIVEATNKKFQVAYNWLKKNQEIKTGLVHSYKGDEELENIAFTYDQSLALMNFVSHRDFENAKKLLDFYVYKARKKEGGYLNAYHVHAGSVMEWTAHVGPNVWFGMGILKYIEATGEREYLKYAHMIASFILKLQSEDGGVKGGPNDSWYSTEHNIDCVAFFRMMYLVSNNRKYDIASEDILAWIKNTVYLPKENRFMRGKNDRIIATDTVSFGIPAIGPKTFYDLNIDPEKLIEYMEKNTKVKARFTNNKNEVFEVTGFDYTKPGNIGRLGVVSSEWTGQMVTTYQSMAEYFKTRNKEKSKYYNNMAKFYLEQLGKMIIFIGDDSNVAGLPYASSPDINTGHGWATPKAPFAISVAGTAYTLLAYTRENPFILNQSKDEFYS
ncbi:MAG: hypothetical protein GY817_08265 [bacterium]|nr:hypothetical protein [bacterium]